MIIPDLLFYQLNDLCFIIGKKAIQNNEPKNRKTTIEYMSKEEFIKHVLDFSSLPEIHQRNIKTYCDNHEILYTE